MYTKTNLINDLERLNIDKNGTLLVHSSMKGIGNVDGNAATVLNALSEYMENGLLVLPTHTWSYINAENPNFYVEKSESCIGILPELFRKRPNVYRSFHPTHSVAALGKDARDFIKDDHKYDTPCARGSSYGKLLDRKGTIMLLGVDLRRNTFIHGIEEWLDIPGRLTDDHEQLYTILGDGTKISVPSRRHCGKSWSLHFWKVNDILQEQGAMYYGTFGDAFVRICDTVKVTDILTRMLKVNPDLFSDDEPLNEKLYEGIF
ncbi:aminoglycoside 3-N-acetyltransferase [Natranaerovirga pectinivora]|uniref:Aminoglycoside N(3)-acetyltransferase n=1 Tax=Natranaerovirga pectinivora TaxID=682400 RepID=A0A4R3MRJ8_9FIRM|nr:AAC(3) family N-acetyltransferase [Natranaerovirga pectinivora]TCT15407.1 aminoglycoside 3-N-acetyltransferase [Natranaerovirga pectinivora]